MYISVEFCERQTGATTKALGTAIAHPNSVFVLPEMSFQCRKRELEKSCDSISILRVSDLRGRAFDTIVVDNYNDLSLDEKKNLYEIVSCVQPKDVYIFRNADMGGKYSDIVKGSIDLVKTLKINGFDVNDINEMFKEKFAEGFTQFYYDFCTEPAAHVKVCKFLEDEDAFEDY